MCMVECQNCGALQPKVPAGTIVKMCFDCVRDYIHQQIDSPKNTTKRTGYPKGWKFMKVFVYSDGTVYHKGVEQPELKDTLPITTIEVKEKKTKIQKAREKQEASSPNPPGREILGQQEQGVQRLRLVATGGQS